MERKIAKRFEAAFSGTPGEAIWRIFLMLPEVKSVLEPTYGRGNFYKKATWLEVIGGDIDKRRARDIVVDMCYLPFRDNSIDCVVLDPPFLHSGRRDNTIAPAYEIFGTRKRQSARALIELYKKAGSEAFRVASKAVVMKCADMVDSHEFFPIAAILINIFGYPWDMVITTRGNSLPIRGEVHHFRHNYAYYLVWRSSSGRSRNE